MRTSGWPDDLFHDKNEIDATQDRESVVKFEATSDEL